MGKRDEKLKQEIEEMEGVVFGNPEVEDSQDSPITEASEEAQGNQEETEVQHTEPTEGTPESKQEPEQKPEEDWKKRFVNFKAAADSTIHKLRKENASLAEQMSTLSKQVSTLTAKLAENTSKEDVYSGLFTDEEKELLGEDTIAVLKKLNAKAIESEVKPLQQKLRQVEEQRQADIKKNAQEQARLAQVSFLERLSEVVSDYAEIDSNPNFLSWMKEVDPVAGVSRAVLFKQAESYGDVKRVADFFIEWKQLNKKPEEILEESVSPSRSASVQSGHTADKTVRITKAFVDQFYHDLMRTTKYKGKSKQVQEIQAMIDNAFLNGQIYDR